MRRSAQLDSPHSGTPTSSPSPLTGEDGSFSKHLPIAPSKDAPSLLNTADVDSQMRSVLSSQFSGNRGPTYDEHLFPLPIDDGIETNNRALSPYEMKLVAAARVKKVLAEKEEQKSRLGLSTSFLKQQASRRLAQQEEEAASRPIGESNVEVSPSVTLPSPTTPVTTRHVTIPSPPADAFFQVPRTPQSPVSPSSHPLAGSRRSAVIGEWLPDSDEEDEETDKSSITKGFSISKISTAPQSTTSTPGFQRTAVSVVSTLSTVTDLAYSPSPDPTPAVTPLQQRISSDRNLQQSTLVPEQSTSPSTMSAGRQFAVPTTLPTTPSELSVRSRVPGGELSTRSSELLASISEVTGASPKPRVLLPSLQPQQAVMTPSSQRHENVWTRSLLESRRSSSPSIQIPVQPPPIHKSDSLEYPSVESDRSPSSRGVASQMARNISPEVNPDLLSATQRIRSISLSSAESITELSGSPVSDSHSYSMGNGVSSPPRSPGMQYSDMPENITIPLRRETDIRSHSPLPPRPVSRVAMRGDALTPAHDDPPQPSSRTRELLSNLRELGPGHHMETFNQDGVAYDVFVFATDSAIPGKRKMDADVARRTEELWGYLRDMGLGHHIPKFIEQDVDVDIFITLSEEDLQQLGVDKLGQRRTMRVLIDAMIRQMHDTKTPATPLMLPTGQPAVPMASTPEPLPNRATTSPALDIKPEPSTPTLPQQERTVRAPSPSPIPQKHSPVVETPAPKPLPRSPSVPRSLAKTKSTVIYSPPKDSMRQEPDSKVCVLL